MRLIAAVLLMGTALNLAQAQRTEHFLPKEQQIALVVTQAERAFDSYEQAMSLERTLSSGSVVVSKDKQVLDMSRKILADIRKEPERVFNSPMRFLLVTNLDDASRNMALCSGQGGMEAANGVLAGNKIDSASEKLRVAQVCQDASVLLYTVSESALDLYSQYLAAQFELMQAAGAQLQQCVGLLKQSRPK